MQICSYFYIVLDKKLSSDTKFYRARFTIHIGTIKNVFLGGSRFLIVVKKKYGKNAYSCECVLVLQLLSTASKRMTGKPGSNIAEENKVWGCYMEHVQMVTDQLVDYTLILWAEEETTSGFLIHYHRTVVL